MSVSQDDVDGQLCSPLCYLSDWCQFIEALQLTHKPKEVPFHVHTQGMS